MKRKLKTALRRTIILLPILIVAFYAEEDWRGWHALNQFKKECEAKGEKFDRQSVVPSPVPDDQNFAFTPIVATSYEWMLDKNGHEIKPHRTNVIERLRMSVSGQPDTGEIYLAHATNAGDWAIAKLTDLKGWQQYYRKIYSTTNEFPIPPQPQSPAADVLLALSKHDLDIEELREAAKLPGSRFPLEYDNDNPAAILLPHLASLRICSQTLALRATAELQNDQSGKALDDVKLSLRLVESVRNEPLLISHLVRLAILQISVQPIYEGLAAHRWSDAQLIALEAELAKLNYLADYKLVMRGEMILFQHGLIDYLRHHPEKVITSFGVDAYDSEAPRWQQSLCHLIPSGWFYQNELSCARLMVQFYIPLADTNRQTISPAMAHQADAAIESDRSHLNAYNVLENLLLPALSSAARKFAYAQTSADLARTAITLERCRLAHGEFPEKLEALAPQFIKEVPHDVIGGQPLHYHRTADGKFILYSVGWNETDESGVVGLKKDSERIDISQGDWVWKY